MIGFDNYKVEAIKIDTRPIYKSDVDSAWFAAWRAGKTLPGINADWNKKIAERVAAGARHLRIKLVDPSNELAFEVQRCTAETLWLDQIAVGTEYYFMMRDDFYKLVAETFPCGWMPHDFWLFDHGAGGIEQFYNDDFSYARADAISPNDIPKYIALRDAVMSSDKLFSFDDFKERYLT